MSRPDPFSAFPTPARVNVGSYLVRMANVAPEREAVVAPDGRGGWRRIDYAGLARRAGSIAGGLARRGVVAGDRACLFVRPGVDLVAITFALCSLGAVPILADPGMGRERLLACMRRMRPRVFVGMPLAHAARKLFPASFASVELAVTVGRRLFWGGPTLDDLTRAEHPLECRDTAADDVAAIFFTSGSTGPPKGVVYTHGMLDAQVEALRALYAFEPGEIDLACFPLFALFDAALEMTSVFPEMDVSRPGTCDPAKIVAAIRGQRVSTTFGSPAIWRRVVPHCLERGLCLDSLRRVLIAGAPVPPRLVEDFRRVLPEGADVFTPYGATEALPVTSISGSEILGEALAYLKNGAGTCVGRAAPGIDLRLIEVTDDALERWDEGLEVPLGRPGEICVRGPVVTREYADEPQPTARAKVPAVDGGRGVWHRTGDVGRLDDEGRLWFYGRKSHRLETRKGLRMPVPTENVFNLHPRVHRTALVGIGEPGDQEPLLVVEPEPSHMPRSPEATRAFIRELLEVGRGAHASADVQSFLFHPRFPVDARHNAKIDREALAQWAREQLA